MRKTAMLLLALLLCVYTYARKIYISSTSGNDNFSFTSAQNSATPWATLAKLRANLNSINAGDTIAFKCGDVFPGSLSINRSGTATNPIVFTFYGNGAKPKFTGTGTTINYLFYAFSQSFLVFDGLEITDPLLQSDINRTQLSNIQRAITFDQCTNSVVKNCKISYVGTGVYLVGGGYHKIENDTIFDLRMIVNTNDGSQPGNNDDYGANPITLSSSNNTIRNNFLYGAWAQSFDYVWDGGAFEVYDNGSGVHNNKICYNTIYDCMGGFEVDGNCDSNEIYYNKFINNTSITYFHNTVMGWKFHNNVIVETNTPRFPADFIFGVRAGGIVDLTLKNNVIQISTGGIIAITNRFSPFIHTHNIYNLSNNNILNFPLGTAEQTVNSVLWTNTSDPNPVNWDYMPANSSVLNNNGTPLGITTDFLSNPVSNPPDIGILERTEPIANLSCVITATPVKCFGGSSVVTVSASGGTPPYTGTGTFNVTAGSYNYTVTDSNGFLSTSGIIVTQPTAMTVVVSFPPISVYGGSTSVTVTANGGTGNSYTYSLSGSPYQSSNIFNNIVAGTYTVIAKDMNGCTKTRSFVISQPANTLLISASASAINCNGGNALVSVTANGGTAPYSGTGSFSVTAGNYSYTVTDAAGTVRTTNITITEPSPIVLSLSADRIMESGGTTTIMANASGGAGNYQYRLNNGTFQPNGVFPGIYPGVDTVYVIDSLGCIVSASITIPQPSTLNISVTATPIRCNGAGAQVTVTANGGTPPYTGVGIFNVVAGTYTYSVTDSNGVVRTSNITITQPAALSVSVSYPPISVYGGTTAVTARPTGGVAPFVYSLGGSVYQSSNVFGSLYAGTYTVFVKDANGCIKTRSFVLSQPANTLQCTISSTPVNCNGDSSTVIVSASGGTPPYTGTGTFTVPAGNYSYTVSDASGAVRTSNVSITEPPALTLSLSSSRIIEYGGSATITAAAGGGTGSYLFNLNNNIYQTSGLFSGVLAGEDTVTVRDSLGCTLSSVITIVQPAPFNILLNATAINCFGGTSTVTVSGSGGTAPYTGTGTFVVTAGTYSYTIIDSNGVSRTASIRITQPAAISTPVLTQGAAITVYGGSTTVTVTGVSGGTPPYSYAVDNGAYQASNVLTIRGGTHTVFVKDSKGCMVSKSIFIKQPLKLFLVKATSPTCIQQVNGMITVRADGGTPSYRYRLLKKNGIIQNTVYGVDSTFSNLAPANYTIRVRDNNGNGDTTSIYVVVPASTVNCGKSKSANNTESDFGDLIKDELVTVFPNPSASSFTLQLGSQPKVNKAELFNNEGNLIERLQLKATNKLEFGKGLPSGIYYLRVCCNGKVWSRKLIRL